MTTKNKKAIAAALFLLILFLLTAGCAPEYQEGEHEATVVVEDYKGRSVEIPEDPQRIISLSPGNTEIAYALGLEDRLVGVTDYCNYPPEAEDKTSIGGFQDPNMEKIVEMEPELVLAGSMHEDEVFKLEDLGISVLALVPETLEDIFETLEMVAVATGNTEEYHGLEEDLSDRLDEVKEAVEGIPEEERVRVYYEVYSDPVMSAGEGSLVHEVVTTAGGLNIFSDIAERYPQVSQEKILEEQPQVILFPDYHGTADMLAGEMGDRPGWESLPAIEEERIYAVDDDVFARPGPRLIDAVEMAAEIFYPEYF